MLCCPTGAHFGGAHVGGHVGDAGTEVPLPLPSAALRKYRQAWTRRAIDARGSGPQNRLCNRELVVACSCLPFCCTRAQRNGGNLPRLRITVPSIPHARAAGPPTGRSLFLRRGLKSGPGRMGGRVRQRSLAGKRSPLAKRSCIRVVLWEGNRRAQNERGGWCKPPLSN